MTTKSDIRQQILNVTETLVQTNGYNAFSYRDVAQLVGIKTSSIHYYFPTKADLGQEVVKKQIELLSHELAKLKQTKQFSCRKKLELFFDSIFTQTYLSNRKMCLGGMLASDVLTLPDIIQNEVRIFFNQIETWLKGLLTEGIERKEFCLAKKDITHQAILILSSLEGALLLARLYHDEKRLTTMRKHIMEHLTKG